MRARLAGINTTNLFLNLNLSPQPITATNSKRNPKPHPSHPTPGPDRAPQHFNPTPFTTSTNGTQTLSKELRDSKVYEPQIQALLLLG